MHASRTLDNGDQAIGIVERLRDYSLNPQSDTGKHKAVVFQAALGYSRSNLHGLADQIRRGIRESPAMPGEMDEHGQRYTVDISVTGPTGKTVRIRTGWIYDPDPVVPRMITAIVL